MKIAVEIVYALPDVQTSIQLEVDDGVTVGEAIAASGIIKRHPDLDLGNCRIGVWGSAVLPTQTLRNRDRVEIYRGLVADPKQVRRKRAEDQRKRKRPC